ncbi:MAG: tetratricopeptide repeat protein [Planctomycetota bacterium]|jgi:tetratricopeptide (TPR) repeat protein
MTESMHRVQQLFDQALDLPPGERASFLDAQCIGEPEIRAEVEALLMALGEADQFLVETEERPVSSEEQPGALIDRYKLLQEIGEGGFGVVWMAEQQEPVKRKVALKIIKLGMDSKQVVARFEAERQALALMEHPNIAKVLDGGATPAGRPYFVMELVKGVPITEFCDQANLQLEERLELFEKVCQAVQHAHQKGVIHRDLKPSNILVTMDDSGPEPKVIDFGIAKATSQELTRRTLFTEFRQMLGTPEYMAPEQAEFSSLDVDTRADVYSLGVILYELLTGTKPFELGELMEKGYVDMLRQIREIDPPKPSTRLSTLGDLLVGVAKRRRMEPKRLGRLLRGELDWIVMKALEKDRRRRYATARELAEDLVSYREELPVSAGPPGIAYRLSKFARRHRAAVFAGGVLLLALLAGVIGTGLALQRALDAEQHEREARERAELDEALAEREAARAAAVLGLIQRLLASIDPHSAKGPDYTLRQVLNDFEREFTHSMSDQPEVEAVIRTTLGAAYRNLGMTPQAERHLRAAMQFYGPKGKSSEDARAQAFLFRHWSWLLHDQGDFTGAEDAMAQSVQFYEELEERMELGVSLTGLADMRIHLGDYAVADDDIRRAMRIFEEEGQVDGAEMAMAWSIVARSLSPQGRIDEAIEAHGKALALYERLVGEDNLQAGTAANNLAILLADQKRYEEAEPLYRRSLENSRRWRGPDHVDHSAIVNNLANVLGNVGQMEEAMRLHEEALEIQRRKLPADHPMIAATLHGMGTNLWRQGRSREAEPLIREALEIRERHFGADHIAVASSLSTYGILLNELGRAEEAEKVHRRSNRIYLELQGLDSINQLAGVNNLSVVLKPQGRIGEMEAQYWETFQGIKQTRLREHPWMMAIMLDLLRVLREADRMSEAVPVTREILAIRRKQAAEDPRIIAAAEEDHAEALLAAGRSEAAEDVLRNALRVREATSADSWMRWNCSSLLGEALLQQDRLDEAEALLFEAYENIKPPQDQQAAGLRALERLHSCYVEMAEEDDGFAEEAERLGSEVQAMRSRLKENQGR